MDWCGDEYLYPCISVWNSNMVVPTWPPRFISWAWEKLGTCALLGTIILFLERRQLCRRLLWYPRGRYKDRLASQGLFTVSTGSWDIREAGSGLTCLQVCVWWRAAGMACSQDKCCIFWRDPLVIKAWATKYQKTTCPGLILTTAVEYTLHRQPCTWQGRVSLQLICIIRPGGLDLNKTATVCRIVCRPDHELFWQQTPKEMNSRCPSVWM